MKPSPFSNRTMPKKELNASMNVVPYIDVMLVLLVIFMVTTPMLTTGVDVELPKEKTNSLSTGTNMPIIISLLADGSLTLNSDTNQNTPISQQELINTLIMKQSQNDGDIKVMLNADQSNQYGTIMQLMASLQQAGIQKVGLLTGTPLPDDH